MAPSTIEAMEKTKAVDVMTREVLSVDADWTLNELRAFLVSHSITGGPVTDAHGKLVGVVSATDLMRAAAEGTESTDRNETDTFYTMGTQRLATYELRNYHIEQTSSTKVRDIMTPVVFEVAPDASLFAVADMMARGRIHRVFVAEGGKVVGVVAALDLVRVLRDKLDPSAR